MEQSAHAFGKSKRGAACGGRLRRRGAAGLRRPQAAARTVLTDRPQCWTSPQPPIFTEVVCSNLDCVAVGSPQPPPGGGLHFASRRSARADPSARLRACLVAGSTTLETEQPPARFWRPGPNTGQTRPRAEGCISRPAGPLMQARPLGCWLVSRLGSIVQRSAGRSPNSIKEATKGRCACSPAEKNGRQDDSCRPYPQAGANYSPNFLAIAFGIAFLLTMRSMLL